MVLIGRAVGVSVGGLFGLTSCGFVRLTGVVLGILKLMRWVMLVPGWLVEFSRMEYVCVVGWFVVSGLLVLFVGLVIWCCVSWLFDWFGSIGWVVGCSASSVVLAECVGLVGWFCVAWLGALVFVGFSLGFGGFGSSIFRYGVVVMVVCGWVCVGGLFVVCGWVLCWY